MTDKTASVKPRLVPNEPRPQSAKALVSTDEPLVMMTRTQLSELVTDAVISALAEFESGKAPPVELVSGVEMARLIGISRTSMHRLRVDGCPAIAVGDTHRFRPRDVLTWLQVRGEK